MSTDDVNGRRPRSPGTPTPSAGPGRRGRGPGPGKPHGPALPLLARLLSSLRHDRGLVSAVAAVSVLTAAFDLLPPLVIRLSVDRFILGDRQELIWVAAVALMGLSLVHGTVDFLRLYLTAVLGQRAVFSIRTALFEHLNRLSFSFYDSARSGDIVSRATADVDTLTQFYGRAAVVIATNFLFLLGILVVLAVWNWQLCLVYLLMLPLIVHGMFAYTLRVRPAMGRMRRKLADLTARLQNSLAGILVVKVLGREDLEARRFDAESRGYRDANVEAIRITSLWMPYVNVIMGVGAALVLWAAGYGVMLGAVTLGTLVAFTVYVGMLFRPIRQTGMMLSATMQSLAAAERVFEVLDTQPEIKDAPDARPLEKPRGGIQLDGVCFSYNGRDDVLRNVSFGIRPGELVALVGPSGAGKSTLVHLLLRFYDPTRGRVLFDGLDIAHVTVKSLRESVGIAFQNAFLFDATIGENIALGNPSASQRDIERCARAVELHDFIAGQPQGYATPVGERGVALSGGQRQRVALARVLLREPRILVLDEPTASVDAETERKMEAAMEAVASGRTTIVIAHRLWTVHHADHIIVLDKGSVAEQAVTGPDGSAHETLMERGGLYQRLYALQFRDETAEADRRGGE